MLPFIIAGVAIGAGVLAAIFNEATEAEREQQRALRRRHEEAVNQLNIEKERLKKRREERCQEIRDDVESREEWEWTEYEAQRTNWARQLAQDYIAIAEVRLKEKENLCNEIWTTYNQCKSALTKQNSILRKNALQALMRELAETANKTIGYTIFLKRYIKKMKCYSSDELPPELPFQLPEEWFYLGKLIYKKKGELEEHGQISEPATGLPQNYCFTEFDFIKDKPDDALIPLMCDRFNRAALETPFSSKKGYFLDVVRNSPRSGIPAIVKEVGKGKTIKLKFADAINLTLYRSFLEDPARVPPIGSERRVFPIDWKWDLSYDVKVSERSGDCFLACDFDEIPVIFSADQWDDFCQRLQDNAAIDAPGEWKVAPLNEDILPHIDYLKLQLGNYLCFSARVVNECDRLHFEFVEFLDESQFPTASDIFMIMECVLTACLKDEIDQLPKEVFDNMASLYLRASSEFKIQFQIKQSRHGIEYFNRLSDSINTLINYKTKGKSVVLHHRWELCESKSYKYKLNIIEKLMFKEFISANSHGSKTTFIVEVSPGSFIRIDPYPDGSSAIISSASDLSNWLSSSDSLTVYCKEFPYPEIKQAQAIDAFKSGKLANPVLQPFALDSSRVVSSVNRSLPQLNLINRNISSDKSQENAVLRAMSEDNIYFIQGPPGTGKTTVIREIIEQELTLHPEHKILLVSQANVAVDNVLKKFIDKNITFIRCAKDSKKVDSILEEKSFKSQYDKYVNRISRKMESEPENILLKYWHEHLIMGDEPHPALGSLLLKNVNLVGATCVGLENRSFGLDNMAFDLVIMDEAGKALPGELLIPYNRARKIIIIGDHKQLPPTVDSAYFALSRHEDEDDLDEDREDLFATSLFQRMFEKCGDGNKTMLTTQYRMPAVIGSLISELFYEGKLSNAFVTKDYKPVLLAKKLDKSLQNIVFLSHFGPEFSMPGKSVTNHYEINLVRNLLSYIVKQEDGLRIAIITPYKGQKRLLQESIGKIELTGDNEIIIDTIDSFQGDEADVVIFCTTRTQKKTKFFSDVRRLNVAISRTKRQLIIIGSKSYFLSYGNDSVTSKLIKYIDKHGTCIDNERYFSHV